MFARFFRNRTAGVRKTRTAPGPRRSNRFTPQVEVLQGRLLPSVTAATVAGVPLPDTAVATSPDPGSQTVPMPVQLYKGDLYIYGTILQGLGGDRVYGALLATAVTRDSRYQTSCRKAMSRR